jgi:tRNA threonylcarbamoyladenosine biosynthesis protein TsaB
MNILAFDTCFGACSAALSWTHGAQPGSPREGAAHRFEPMQKGHAERLIPMIGELLQDAPITLSQLDRIAVTLGPGTFTGARIGVAAARALSLSSGVGVSGVSSLALLSRQVRARLLPEPTDVTCAAAETFSGADIAIAVDARRDEIYFQLFGDREPDPLTEPLLISADRAADLLRGPKTIVAGSGAAQVCRSARRRSLELAPEFQDIQPDASSLATMEGLPLLSPVLPLYLRPPNAKPQSAQIITRAL